MTPIAALEQQALANDSRKAISGALMVRFYYLAECPFSYFLFGRHVDYEAAAKYEQEHKEEKS